MKRQWQIFNIMIEIRRGKLQTEVLKMKNRREVYLLDRGVLQNGANVGMDFAPIITDPNGSYTGRPRDPEDKPIQDADDL